MNNLRKFQNNAAYAAATLVKPAVSLIADTNGLHYDPAEDVTPMLGDIRLTFDIQDTSNEVVLYNAAGGEGESGSESAGQFAPANMWIDGVEVTPVSTYRFETTGEHTVEFGVGDLNNIGSNAFYNISCTKAEIGGNVTTIDNSAFDGCSDLTFITFGTGFTSIGDAALNRCTNLTSVTIPNSVTSIGSGAFAGCSSLTSITVEATTPPTLGSNAFEGTNYNMVIYVPASSVDAYKAANGWSEYASRITAIV